MMVSKVAVVALVAILAVPILIGYGMNLSEVTRTEYAPEGDSVNVTQLLQTGTAYTTANAEITSLNTDFEYRGTPYVPVYTTTNTTNSTVQWDYSAVTLAAGATKSWRLSSSVIELYIYVGANYPSFITYERLDSNGVPAGRTYDIESVHYFADSGIVQKTYYGGTSYYTVNDTSEYLTFYNAGTTDVTLYYYNRSTSGTNYVKLADGFKIVDQHDYVQLNTPDKTKSILISADLNTITDSSYYLGISAGNMPIRLVKTTSGTTINWAVAVMDAYNNPVTVIDTLYYDPNKSSNTYQIYLSQELIGSYQTEPIPILGIPSYTYYIIQMDIEFRYVGNWPTLIGNANYFQKYEYSWTKDYQSVYDTFDRVRFNSSSGDSPKLRIDGALYSAFAYNIISDTTYSPADFKQNPTTTLSVKSAGSSLEFGGNTYTVDNTGNITLGTHKVSTNGLKLESVPVAGGYENKINGNAISTTAQPSTIRFNGYWGASVSTVGNSTITITKTDWTPGEFGWDGIDQNFLIVGMLTALGVFIALGIAYRRTKAALGALLVVCGGAIVLFFTML